MSEIKSVVVRIKSPVGGVTMWARDGQVPLVEVKPTMLRRLVNFLTPWRDQWRVFVLRGDA